MMYPAILFLFSLLTVDSSFSYPHFPGLNQHSQLEKMLDPEATNWRTLKNNDIVPCNPTDILNFLGIDDLQGIIEGIAASNGISPYMVLKKLHRRMKTKEDNEENMIHITDASPPAHPFSHSDIEAPPVIKPPPETNRAPYYLPHNHVNEDNMPDTQVVFVPVTPSKLPVGKVPEHKPRNINSMGPLMGKMSNMLPGAFHSPRSNHPKPLVGASVRVNSGDPHSPISRDVTVTISPLMTLIEALRQAENKYQDLLGFDHDTDIFTFAHSEALNCYVIKSINNVVHNEVSAWKVTIMDRDGQVVYDSFCLPNGVENIVKPGFMISLTYVPLNT